MKMVDQLGKNGFWSFKEYHKEIFQRYRKYGEVVLDKDLKDHADEKDVKRLKNYFKNSKNEDVLEKKLFKFWKEKYRIVISDCSGIARAYEFGITEDILTRFVHEENSGKFEIIITEEFFEKLKAQKSYSNEIYVMYSNKIYKVILTKSLGGGNAINVDYGIDMTKVVKDN